MRSLRSDQRSQQRQGSDYDPDEREAGKPSRRMALVYRPLARKVSRYLNAEQPDYCSHLMTHLRVTQINIYPIKSTAGISLPRSRVTRKGLALDRLWMLVDTKGQAITGREFPALTLVHTRVVDEDLTVAAPGVRELQILIVRNPMHLERSGSGATNAPRLLSARRRIAGFPGTWDRSVTWCR